MSKKLMSKKLLVNNVKLERATEIAKLLNGTLQPKTEGQLELKSKFESIFKEEDVKVDSKDAIEFIYIKLGGLVTTIEYIEALKEKSKTSKKKKPASTDDESDEDDDE